MQPSEVRRRVLADHQKLRESLASLDRLAGELARGEPGAADRLRGEARALLGRLRNHMYWEDLHLRPALLEADAWGRERAARLDADHAEQRQMIDDAMAQLDEDARPGDPLLGIVAELARQLRLDMAHEEETLLDERVLRDDVVAIDVEAG